MAIKFKLIAACCDNMGIGKNGDLPWRLKNEMAHFTRMTTETLDANKKNVVILGRTSWDCIPNKYKPLAGRINFILTSRKLDVSQFEDTYVFYCWNDIVNRLNDANFKQKYEDVWVAGGSKVYEAAMSSEYFYRLYLTRIKKEFECDTFFPNLVSHVEKVSDTRVPQGIQEEKGIQWEIEVWENRKLKLDN
ncbi:dihydrofolate reductase [Coccinella septempunctata]|uniref:dihydrofolate reductase n=1 Tax=Coccinella septempunctata TaxID=41139 RepID=UPI001D08EF1D|nr:dihydrofolate reductase [Coccinella septempunctata]XP_044745482.1 dihydrofolate reductase [Coccinella septempunctata]